MIDTDDALTYIIILILCTNINAHRRDGGGAEGYCFFLFILWKSGLFRLYTSTVYEETTNKPFAKSATVVPYVA